MKNKIKLILLAIFALINGAAVFPWEYSRENQRGISEFINNNYAESEKHFNQAIKDNPAEIKLRFNLADSLYKQDKFIESQAIFMEILKDNKLGKDLKEKVYYNLGNILYRLGEESNPDMFWPRALNNYKQALLIKPDDHEARENYEFIKNKLNEKVHNNRSNSQSNSSQKSEQNNIKKQEKTNSYSNSSSKNPEKDINKISKSEMENLLQELKKQEEGMQNFINRRKPDYEHEKSGLDKSW